MYMALEEVLGVQFTKTDLVTFATGKRSLVLIYFDKNHIRAGFIFQNFGGQGIVLDNFRNPRVAFGPFTSYNSQYLSNSLYGPTT